MNDNRRTTTALRSTVAFPITLVLSETERVRIYPGQTTPVTKDQVEKIRKNSGCMSFINSGELLEV